MYSSTVTWPHMLYRTHTRTPQPRRNVENVMITSCSYVSPDARNVMKHTTAGTTNPLIYSNFVPKNPLVPELQQKSINSPNAQCDPLLITSRLPIHLPGALQYYTSINTSPSHKSQFTSSRPPLPCHSTCILFLQLSTPPPNPANAITPRYPPTSTERVTRSK